MRVYKNIGLELVRRMSLSEKIKKKYHCKRCGKQILKSEYENAVGTGFCYGCWVNFITDCQAIREGEMKE